MQEGVGRRVGEQSEHFWSRVKPFSLLARYMSRAHWWDGFNTLCALLVYRQQRDLPELLRKKLKAIPITIGTLSKLACMHACRDAAPLSLN